MQGCGPNRGRRGRHETRNPVTSGEDPRRESNVAPADAGGGQARPQGRPAGSEPVQWPGLPRDETRTFTLTGPQPPKRTPVTPEDADRYPDGCFW